jgi:L-alanine-DL-glutamate epimerase-like enolase superfamily enzyme
MPSRSQAVPISHIEVKTFAIPTDFPEADGTFAWDRTTLVLVEVWGGGKQGLGYTYADTATATLIHATLAPHVKGMDAMSPPAVYMDMWRRVRNLGRPGICSMAISAVDCALWDLKARLLGLPLVTLLGQVREAAPIYGSGGFTSYSDRQLVKQLSGWVGQGIPRVKMKIGRDAQRDVERVRTARSAIGRSCMWTRMGLTAVSRRWRRRNALPALE